MCNIKIIIRRLKLLRAYLHSSFILKSSFARFGSNSKLEYPCHIESPKDVSVEENVNIRFGLKIINNIGEKVTIRKNTTLAPNVTIVTNNHVPVVGIPIFLLTTSHICDKSKNITIEEDCWVGTDVKLLSGCHLGRGAIVGAGAIVTKDIPPYAVVVGNPARIVAVRFTEDQIIEHEMQLYSPEHRFSKIEIDELFDNFYKHVGAKGLDGHLSDNESAILLQTKVKTNYREQI